ncbi:hypothetical protein TWF694_002467 [Orbilia ellipsospora]|uniref:Uncharacterized protein n=1 Tax=Orbilia ellipsospora TaxID=2528407 RepID=A0AAV9X217_9PEZI
MKIRTGSCAVLAIVHTAVSILGAESLAKVIANNIDGVKSIPKGQQTTVSANANRELGMFIQGVPVRLGFLSFSFPTQDLRGKTCPRWLDDSEKPDWVRDSKKRTKQDKKKYGTGSLCFARDRKLAQLIDGLLTFPRPSFKSLDDELKTPRPIPINVLQCGQRNVIDELGSIFLGAGWAKDDCRMVPSKLEFITPGHYSQTVTDLFSRISESLDYIDAWACKDHFGPKSMTYFTLFLRTGKDSLARKLGGNYDGSQPIAHFGEYPQLLEKLFKNALPDLDLETKEKLEELKTRFADTKMLMEDLGRSEESLLGVAQTRCPMVENILP